MRILESKISIFKTMHIGRAFYLLYSEILGKKNIRSLSAYIMRYMPFNAVSDNLVRKSSQGTLQLHPVGMHKSTFFFR